MEQLYQFIGNTPMFYGQLPGIGSLEAEPGMILPFENPPTDGLWVLYKPAKETKKPAGEQVNG